MSATSSTSIVAKCERGCLSAALAYRRRGWSILPMRMADKRPAVRWKRYQRQPASETTLRRWFANGEYGVGVIFGAVSGGLVSRDFDRMGSYDHWAEAHPDLAAILPTVATKRGRHVYCRASHEHVEAVRQHLGKQGGTGAIHLADGELRAGEGCYSVLPPSRHPTGIVYRWVVPLPDGPLPEVADLLAAGLLDSWPTESEPCDREHRENGEDRENRILQKMTEEISDGGCAMNCERLPADCPEAYGWPEAVQRAIAEAIPTRLGQRHRLVFALARGLRAIPSLADADPRDLRPYVERWHELALSAISTEPFEESWIDFLRGWPRVKYPKGEEPLTLIFQRAVAGDPPDTAKQYEQPALRLLVALCAELQRAAGDGPFYLSCRTAGRLLGVDHSTASRWLFLLVADGVLAEVEKGDRARRRASRYRYLAGEK